MRFDEGERLRLELGLIRLIGVRADGEGCRIDAACKLALHDQRLAEVDPDRDHHDQRHDQQQKKQENRALVLTPEAPGHAKKCAQHTAPQAMVSAE